MMLDVERYFQTYYLLSESRCPSFYIVSVTVWGGGGGVGGEEIRPTGRRRPKKPVRIGLGEKMSYNDCDHPKLSLADI